MASIIDELAGQAGFRIVDPTEKKPVETPPAEPPQGDPPPADPPNNNPPPANSPTDPTKVKLSEMLGFDFFKDKDNEFIKKEIGSLSERAKTFEAKNKELEQELQNAESPFANETEAKLFHFRKSNPAIPFDLAYKVVNSDFSKMESVDLLVLKEVMSNPDDDQKMVRKHIEKQYGRIEPLTNEEKTELTQEEIKAKEEEIEDNKYRLEKAKKLAVKELTDIVGKIELPKKLSAEEKKKKFDDYQTALKENWSKVSDKYFEKMEKFEIPVLSDDGSKVDVLDSIEITKEERSAIQSEALDVMVKSNIPFNEEGYKVLDNIVRVNYVMKNLPKLIKHAKEKAYAKGAEDYAKKVGNGGAPKPTHVTDAGKKTKAQESDEKAATMFGGGVF